MSTREPIGSSGIWMTNYGKGWKSYGIEFKDIHSDNKVQVIFDECRQLLIYGKIVSLSANDILRLRNFLDAYTTLPDERKFS